MPKTLDRWRPGLLLLLLGAALYYATDDGASDEATPTVIQLCQNWCGMGNQLFRYAAGLGLNRTTTACVFGFDETEWHPAHARSTMAMHVDVLLAPLPPCPASMRRFSWLRLEYALKEDPNRAVFRPPHSIYQPIPTDRPTLVDGCMQSFRYFAHLPHPFFRMRQQDAARRWLGGLATVVHVRRQDKLWDGSAVAPVEFYEAALARLGHPRVAVCTDDPFWVRQQRVFRNATVSLHHDPGFDMALLAAATDAVVIGVGTFGWWGAYLSTARRKYFYRRQYQGRLAAGYDERDYIPYGQPGQGEWIPLG